MGHLTAGPLTQAIHRLGFRQQMQYSSVLIFHEFKYPVRRLNVQVIKRLSGETASVKYPAVK